MDFVETKSFTSNLSDYLDDDEYRTFQRELAASPHRGEVIAGTGGLRKVRIADSRRRKGRRGGIRVIYLHIPKIDRIVLFVVYDKDESAMLSAAEKKELRVLVEVEKRALTAKTQKRRLRKT